MKKSRFKFSLIIFLLLALVLSAAISALVITYTQPLQGLSQAAVMTVSTTQVVLEITRKSLIFRLTNIRLTTGSHTNM